MIQNICRKLGVKKVTIISSILLGTIFIGSFMSIETNAEMQERLSKEIEIAKMRNISYASQEITRIDSELEVLNTEVQKKQNDKYIYEQCIGLNNVKDIPTNCRDITISLKDDLQWKVNSNGVSQEYKQLIGDTPKMRASYLLDGFTHTKGTIDIWLDLGYKYNIDPYLAISIAKADSSLGDQLKTTNNIGNVGNNDRGSTVSYDSKEDGIEAIYKVLNNQYLGKITTVGYLSCGGKTSLGIKDCFQNDEKVYATSKENWNLNVINSLRMIYRDSSIDESYNFRINK